MKHERFIIMETDNSFKCLRVVAEEPIVEQMRRDQEKSNRYDNVFIAMRANWPLNA